ncbi:type II toxin-antitoxin system RelE/ParE family toxin [Microvirga sp. HBU67558]|uniref:type II toxin-antitoxin system RelE/ParE family toxin n=1 Tax=Microvirga sp. HBU67558 TaxID=2824562 RepID=UPI001B39933B|nr:type II toxin-antitoxin system RelE/ParE family toxin [Microvirga sp. HBU67558]MBQ0820958.1 type II toxin-antitoxin system RelE/ParE family toxin [Microvirga sp. HBU67558]
MQTVVETPPYLDAAKEAGLSEKELETIKDMLARNPIAGDLIVGTGGCRKVRVGGRGKGKSGGYRVITFFTGPNLPVFLITVFGKGERSDLTQKERNALGDMTKLIVEGYRRKVAKLPRR